MSEHIQVSSHVIKTAKTQYSINPFLKERWSARSFKEQEIIQEDIACLLEAASWAPSSMNEQPWRYRIALAKTEAFGKMVDCLSPGNQIWAQHAPVLMLCTAETHHANGHPNSYAWYDAGAANQSLLLQAASMGILGHLMGGFHSNKAIDLFEIPPTQLPVVFIALGYPDEPDKLPEPFMTRELNRRSRKSIQEFAQFL